MKAKIQNISAMAIFGTIGLFVQSISLPRAAIASVRGLVGAAVLLLFCLARKKAPEGAAIRKNLWLLLLSGGLMGFNWVFLFESYRHSTVAVGTLCYYLAPLFVTLVSPLVLREKLTAKKALCVLVALLGMVPVSGILSAGFDPSQLKGVAFGVGAAVLYASVVLLNKKLSGISALDRTMVQLAAGGIVPIPYLLLTTGLAGLSCPPGGLAMLAILAVVHTGVAYVLYSGSLAELPAQSAAVLSYLDPVIAVMLSVLVLREAVTPLTLVGAVMILGAAFLSEVELGKKTKAAG